MQFNLTKNQKIIICVLAGILVLTGIIGGSVAIANAAKREQQAKCEHVYDEGTIKSEATCEKPGMIVYTCETCDYEQTEEIPANGHVEIEIAPIPATCKAKGLTDGIQCVTCEKVLVAPVETPLLGHVGKVLEGVANTCTTSGKMQGSQCTRCGEILKEQTVIPAKGHNVVEVKGYAATCTEKGKTNGSKCSDCGKVFSEQEEIPLGAHTGVDTDGICDICGYADIEKLFAAYQQAGAYKEQAVQVGERVAGNVYRIYKSASGIDMTNYGNRLYIFENGTIGFGVKEGSEDVGAIAAWSTMEETNLIYKDYGEYVDFYIAEGTYKMTVGPYTNKDPDGDGYMEFTVNSYTEIGAIIGSDRCFRLVLN